MNTRRICIYCQKWESGGIESFLYNMLTHMDRTGLAIDLVADQLCPSVFTQPLEALGVRFIELSGSLRRIGENRRQFARLLQQRQYDVVHLNVFQGLSLNLLTPAQKAGVLVRIAHSHNTDLRSGILRPLKLWIHRFGSRRYTALATDLWACSGAAADFLFGRESRFRFVPNGIDTARFAFDPAVRQAVRAELGWDDRLIIGHVGRLCEQKNQQFLLTVLAQLRRTRPDCCLLLVGDGPDRSALQQKVKDLQLEDAVLFYGNTSQPQRLLWAMDVFAFPSLFEGLGIVAVEAQAAGLPVLCSDAVPAEAFVTPLAKQLPLSAGAAAWAEAICAVEGNPDRAGAAAAVRAAGFDVKDMSNLLEETYKG